MVHFRFLKLLLCESLRLCGEAPDLTTETQRVLCLYLVGLWVQLRAPLVPQRDIGQVWAADGMVANLDRCVGLFAASDALEEIINMRLGRDSSFELDGGLRLLSASRPGLGIDAVSAVV